MGQNKLIKTLGDQALYLSVVICAACAACPTSYAGTLVALPGHVPTQQISNAVDLGRHAATSKMQLAITLNSKDPAGLSAMIARIYDPADPLYQHYLTPAQFADSFGPSQRDFDQVIQYLASKGLTVTNMHANRLVIDVAATSGAIENAFQIELHDYIAHDGRVVHAPTSDPAVDQQIAPRLNGILGLSTFSYKKPLFKRTHPMATEPSQCSQTNITGSCLTPARIASVYNMSSLGVTGSGETLALFELDGYTASDITTYASTFSITAPTLENVLVDGATGSPGTDGDEGPEEVTLDIQLAAAVAPGLTKIMVYEGPIQTDSETQTSADAETIDVYSRIVTDNLAKVISSSWGGAENEQDSNLLNSEYTLFEEMATQGQSMFAAAGDNGAYDASPYGTSANSSVNTTLEVDDPSSQPYVTAVGGTTLTWTGSYGYSTETSWIASAASGSGQNYNPTEGGGGGISRQWSIPSWQEGLATGANLGSNSMRMTPDVSLDADPYSGYATYWAMGTEYDIPAWSAIGGTSCAAPIWAAFTSLVNQRRVANGQSRIGYFNPTLYQVAKSSLYSSSFHDIADGSTNLYYPAEAGYDLTTGWGTLNGAGLFSALTSLVSLASPPATLILTPGLLSISSSWSSSSGATSYILLRSSSSSGPFTTVASGLTTTSYTDSSLAYGTYYYEVEAVNSAGTSGPSSFESATTLINAPSAPTNLSVQVIE